MPLSGGADIFVDTALLPNRTYAWHTCTAAQLRVFGRCGRETDRSEVSIAAQQIFGSCNLDPACCHVPSP
jgi:hypothetical protein